MRNWRDRIYIYKNTKPGKENLDAYGRDFDSVGDANAHFLRGRLDDSMEPNWAAIPRYHILKFETTETGIRKKKRRARKILLNQVPMLVAFALFAHSPCCCYSLKENSMALVGRTLMTKRSYQVT